MAIEDIISAFIFLVILFMVVLGVILGIVLLTHSSNTKYSQSSTATNQSLVQTSYTPSWLFFWMATGSSDSYSSSSSSNSKASLSSDQEPSISKSEEPTTESFSTADEGFSRESFSSFGVEE